MMKKLLALGLVVLATACNKPGSSQPATETAVSTASSKTDFTGQTLQIYTWSNYLSPDVISEFEKQTKAKVQLNYFSSNEELLAKLQAGARGYDVIMPSGYLLRALRALNLVEKIDAKNWPEAQALLPRYRSPEFDKDLEISVPYAWGTTGIGVNRDKYKDPVDSWTAIFSNPKLAGKITVLDDAPTVVGAALKYLGYDFNDASPEAFAKVKKLLLDQKKALKAYTSEPIPLLESGDATLVQAYSGDVLQLKNKKHKNVEFIMPKEGGELFVDTLVIPKGAKSPDLARAFIRFTLQRQVALTQNKHLFYGPVVDLGNESVVPTPSDEIMKKWQMMVDDPSRMEAIQRLWTELKSS